jgi:hypothetical protein
MISSHKVTEIYFRIDEFFKEFDTLIRNYSLQEAKTGKRKRKFTMSQSEVMTVLIWGLQEPEKFLCLLCTEAYEERFSRHSAL